MEERVGRSAESHSFDSSNSKFCNTFLNQSMGHGFSVTMKSIGCGTKLICLHFNAIIIFNFKLLAFRLWKLLAVVEWWVGGGVCENI